MKDNGLVPKDKLAVTPLSHTVGSTTLIVKSKVPSGETPVWQSATITPSADLKEVKVTPHGQDGKPVGETKKATPTSPTTPTVVSFDKPTTADHLVITLTSTSPTKKTTADLASVISCMPEEGKIFMRFWYCS